jgi:hypothetical protein
LATAIEEYSISNNFHGEFFILSATHQMIPPAASKSMQPVQPVAEGEGEQQEGVDEEEAPVVVANQLPPSQGWKHRGYTKVTLADNAGEVTMFLYSLSINNNSNVEVAK